MCWNYFLNSLWGVSPRSLLNGRSFSSIRVFRPKQLIGQSRGSNWQCVSSQFGLWVQNRGGHFLQPQLINGNDNKPNTRPVACVSPQIIHKHKILLLFFRKRFTSCRKSCEKRSRAVGKTLCFSPPIMEIKDQRETQQAAHHEK